MKARWLGWGMGAAMLLAGAMVATAAVNPPPPDDHGDAGVSATAPGEPDGWMADLLGPGDDDGADVDDVDGPGGPVAMMHGHPGMMGGAWGHGGMHHMGALGGMAGGGAGPRMIAALDLTDAQRTRLADLHDRQARRMITMRADLQTAALDLRKLLRDDTPDRRAIEAQIDKMADIHAAMTKAQINTRLDARAVLTPEQLEKARDLHHGYGRPTGGYSPQEQSR